MNTFLQDLKQPYWWIGVVVVGLFLNVLASYIREWIDRSTLRIFSTLRARTERRRKRIEGSGGDPSRKRPNSHVSFGKKHFSQSSWADKPDSRSIACHFLVHACPVHGSRLHRFSLPRSQYLQACGWTSRQMKWKRPFKKRFARKRG